jgi:hypothetical protein
MLLAREMRSRTSSSVGNDDGEEGGKEEKEVEVVAGAAAVAWDMGGGALGKEVAKLRGCGARLIRLVVAR